MPADLSSLRSTLADELLRASGLPKTAWLHRSLIRLLHGPMEQFVVGAQTFDKIVSDRGLQPAAAGLLERFCASYTALGLETLPSDGPLLVVSNHPGSIDVLLLLASLPRPDVKIISNNIPFLQCLPATSAHLIYGARTNDITRRMSAVRQALRHLQSGGALVLLGTGHIDPDPQVYPDAARSIDRWSPSIELFLRQAPGTRVLPAMVSGVLARRWAHHPITWLRREPRRKRLLAEIIQVAHQALFPRLRYLSPHLSFAAPLSLPALQQEAASGALLPVIIAHAKTLLERHMEIVRSKK
jgi:hypothetical protein